MINTITKVAGTTLKVTFVASGAVAAPISSALLDGADNVVSSVAAVSSGNGMYYALHQLPNSRAWYVNEWYAFISTNTYRERQFVRAVLPEVTP